MFRWAAYSDSNPSAHQMSAQPSSIDSLYLEVNVSLIGSCVLSSSVFTSTCDVLTSRFYQWWILETRALSRDVAFMFLFWRSLDSNLLSCLGSVSNFDVSICLMSHECVLTVSLWSLFCVETLAFLAGSRPFIRCFLTYCSLCSCGGGGGGCCCFMAQTL